MTARIHRSTVELFSILALVALLLAGCATPTMAPTAEPLPQNAPPAAQEAPTTEPQPPADSGQAAGGQAAVEPTQPPAPVEASTRLTGIPEASFSEGGYPPLPENVMEEFAYIGGQGGGGEDALLCLMYSPPSPVFLNDPPVTKPVVVFNEVGLPTCGWKVGEQINVLMTYPDGHTSQKTETAVDGGFVGFYFTPGESDLTGDYMVQFEGASGYLEAAFTVAEPDAPIIIPFPDQNKTLLYGFAPNETVTVYIYNRIANEGNYPIGKLAWWGAMQVDNRGRLMITPQSGSVSDYYIDVVSARSGQIGWYGVTCGQMQSRLRPGSQALVPSSVTEPVIVYSEVGLNMNEIGSLQAGERVTVTGGPKCVDPQIYVQVQSDSGMTGWVPEVNWNGYTLEPAP